MKEVISEVEASLLDQRRLNIVVVNAAVLVKCYQENKFTEVVNDADIITIDGMPLLWVMKFMGYPVKEKVSGPDLFRELLELASLRDHAVYFLGAENKIITEMVKRIQSRLPRLNISGFRDGYFNVSEETEILNEINNSNAEMLFLGLPSPIKENFIYNRDLKTMFAMGVGGVFDIEAGLVKRAPRWMQNYGLEWFYRFIQEPRRLWKRYLVINSIFIYIVMKEIIANRKKISVQK